MRRYGDRVGQGRRYRREAGQADMLAPRPCRRNHEAQSPQRNRLGHGACWARAVVTRAYVPDAGDLVWLTFDPQAGHEQRPPAGLILSPRVCNAKARPAIPVPSPAR
jgi:hypothetical protein